MMNEPLEDNRIYEAPPATSSSAEFDQQVDSIAATLRYLVGKYPRFEIRALSKLGKPRSGYFNDVLEAAKEAAVLNLDGDDVYFAINPTDLYHLPALRLNGVGPGNALQDDQIIGRRLMLIDADPVRPAGVCSTDTEKAAAHSAAIEVVDYLRQQGWPAPVVADSGNGKHLLYRIDLPADDEGLVHRVLQAIDAKFTSTAVKFDTTVGNASRICRMYGTLNRKGANTRERPHRVAAILTAPKELASVPRELLESLAASAPVQPPRTSTSRQLVPVTSAPTALAAMPPKTDDALISRARAKLHTLPIAVEGQNGSKPCFRAACMLVNDFGLSVEQAFPLLQEYSQRCQPPWTDEQLMHKLNDAAKKALQRPEAVGKLAAPEDRGKKRKTVLEMLLETLAARCTMWHDRDDGTPYATIDMPNAVKRHELGGPCRWHQEHYAVSSRDFSLALRSILYAASKKAPSGQAMQVAVDTAAAKARFEGQARKVHLRVARTPNAVYLDLGGRNWRAVKVTPKGWKVVSRVPVRFRRTPRTLALPRPQKGGQIQVLQKLLNLSSLADLQLLVGWLVMVLQGKGPFPVLMLFGEQGSAKSTAAELIRRLVDPVKAGLSSLHKDERDLMTASQNSWIVAFDNITYIHGTMSDSLCRVATNAGFTTRKLYTDCEELLIQVCRPIILNGIGGFATRADLLDRCVVIKLPVIEDENRRTADEVEQAFTKARPYLLGLLLDGVSAALANHRLMKLDASHRMADFERWAAAAMPAFGWKSEDFLAAYAANVAVANEIAIGDHPVVAELQSLLTAYGGRWPKQGQIAGAKALLAELEHRSGDPHLKSRLGWPKSYTGLGQILARLAPALRRLGIIVRSSDKRQTTAAGKIVPITIEDVTLLAGSGSPSDAASS